MNIPTFTTGTVWHVGTMDLADKGMHGASYEGTGLSVSHYPDAWVRIARLGGLPTWALTVDGGTFVDAHALTDDDRERILSWGRDRSLVDDRGVWQASWWDDELEDTLMMLCDTKDEAEMEAEDMEGDVTCVTMQVATDALLERAQQCGSQLTDALELLLPVWVEDATSHDGVWWHDRLDPDRLSAPRGVIVPSRLERWDATRNGS